MHRVERGFGEEAASGEGSAGRKGPREPGCAQLSSSRLPGLSGHRPHLQKEFKGKDTPPHTQPCFMPSPKLLKDGLSHVLRGVKAARVQLAAKLTGPGGTRE